MVSEGVIAIGSPRVPDAVQREAVHRWSGTATDTELERTEPGAVPGLQRITPQSSLRRLRQLVCVCCADGEGNGPTVPIGRCRDLGSIAAYSSVVRRNRAPFLSLRNNFLVCPPGICPRNARDSSTVNSGGCVTVRCAMPRRSR